MAVNLYSYQKAAIDQLRNGSILCGGVGSGKSRTGIAYYFCKECDGRIYPEYSKMKNPKDLYIITTARKRDTLEWEGELAPFLISKDKDASSYDISVVVDSWNNIGKYTKVNDSFFIFDEQRLIGSGAWVKSFYKIAKNNHWILLSATPGDSWSDYIPVFVANGFYKNKTEFEAMHVVYKYYRKWKEVDHYVNQKRLNRHRDEILVNMDYIRPTVHHEEKVIVDYDKVLFKDLIKNRWDYENGLPIKNVSRLCYLLRKATNNHISRYDSVLELCNMHPKVIIFYNFDYEVEQLKLLDYEQGTEIAEWNGHRHEPIPKSNRWVYLVQYSAGAEGWNCTETDTIIFFSQSYSYKTMIQAKGRIDRLNTPYHDLYYYHIRSNSPIDISIARALNAKKNFNERSFISV